MTWTRLAKMRGDWAVLQVNFGEPSKRVYSEEKTHNAFEEDAVVVNNKILAASPKMHALLKRFTVAGPIERSDLLLATLKLLDEIGVDDAE
jgi:hypothetical protein